MNELIKNHKTRLFVYISLSTLCVFSLFSASFITETYKLASLNKKLIEGLENRMSMREHISDTYVPRFEMTEKTVSLHAQLLKNIILRQTEIARHYESILKKR